MAADAHHLLARPIAPQMVVKSCPSSVSANSGEESRELPIAWPVVHSPKGLSPSIAKYVLADGYSLFS